MTKLVRFLPFGVLCVVASGVWMLEDAQPAFRITLATDFVACGLLGVTMMCWALRKGLAGWNSLAWAALGGALVLAGPEMSSVVGAQSLEGASLAIALALTGVVVGVAEGAMDGGELTSAALWPGMVAAVGLLLALPRPNLMEWRGDVAMASAPVLTGVGCVLFRRSEAAGAWKMAAGLCGAAVVFGCVSLVQRGGREISWSGVGLEATLMGLALLSLLSVTAMQYASRFALVPLWILLQGFVVVGSMLTRRVAACGLMLGVAAWAMLSRSTEAVAGEPAVEKVF